MSPYADSRSSADQTTWRSVLTNSCISSSVSHPHRSLAILGEVQLVEKEISGCNPAVARDDESDVAAYAPGDAVFGPTTGMGAYAEYLAVKAAGIAKKPSNLSFEEAASVPVAAQTAWPGIFTHGHLENAFRALPFHRLRP